MDFDDMQIKRMLHNIGNITPIYGCCIENSSDEDDRKVIDYEMLSSISKSLKTKQLKLLHKHIIDVANELYRFSDELDMSDKEEFSCKISIIEALKELNHVAEYLSKYTLDEKWRRRLSLRHGLLDGVEQWQKRNLISLKRSYH